MAGFALLPAPATTRASVRAWRGALALALVGHTLFWFALHQHRGQSAGEAEHDHAMRVRVAPRVAHQVAQTPVQESAPASPQALPPAPPQVALANPVSAPAPQVSHPQPPARAVPSVARPASSAPAVVAPASAPAVSPEVEKAILAMVPESYLPRDELDVTPELLGPWRINHDAIPKGPGAPKKLTVTLRLWVSDTGHIDAFQVLQVEPMVSWYDDLLKTIDTSTLRPALKNGSPVGASWEIELELDLTGEL